MKQITTITSLLSNDFSNVIVAKTDNQDVAYFIDYLKKSCMPEQKVVVTRGHKSRSLSSLFDEWAAALQFPVYFGENLSAFVDCLRDLPQNNFTSLIIVVTNSSELLKEDERCLSDFYNIMMTISNEWQQMYPKRHGITFRLILQEVTDNIDIIETILNDLNVDYIKTSEDWLDLLSE